MQHLTLTLDANDGDLSRLASGAKSKIGYVAKSVADQAVQLHGWHGHDRRAETSAITSNGCNRGSGPDSRDTITLLYPRRGRKTVCRTSW